MGREEEDETIAVLLGDAFNSSWGPFQHFPLLPFCTVPLIQYALDAVSKFDKVYVYLSQSSLEALKESDQVDLPANVFLKQTTALTEGEVLREADALQLKVPFLLLRVGYIGNADLKTYFDAFNAVKRKADSNLVMDCLMSPVSDKSAFVDTFALTPSSRLLHYDHAPRFPASKRLRLPKELLLEHPSILLRQDLSHLHAYFCTPDILPLFTENFDYQTMHHFIHGILTSDLLGKTISCSVLDSKAFKGKGKRAESATYLEYPRVLASASHKMLSRSFYPLAPDEFLPSVSKDRFLSRQARTYIGKRVDLARTTTVSRSLIASSCVVASSTSISKSVIGEECSIAESCTLDNVILGRECVVEENCVLRDCWLGDFVHVRKGCRISEGALVGCNVIIGQNVSALNVASEEPEDLDVQTDILPEPSRGVCWPLPGSTTIQGQQQSDSEDEDELDHRNHFFTRIGPLPRRLSTSSSSTASSLPEAEDDSDEESVASGASTQEFRLKSMSLDNQDEQAFEKEMLASVERAVKEQHTVDNLIIELKTMRMSSNVSLDHVRECFLSFLTRQIPAPSATVGVKEQYGTLSQLVEEWGGVFQKLSPPFTQQDQINLILSLQSIYGDKNDSRLFLLWLRVLYEADLLEEDGVVEWWRSDASREVANDKSRELWTAAKAFVEKLLEESDSDESS